MVQYASNVANSEFERLYIFGAGASGREVAWLAERAYGDTMQIVFVVDKAEYLAETVNGISVTLLGRIEPKGLERFVVAIGDPTVRRRAAKLCTAVPLRATSLVHPNAEVSRWARVEPGSVISAGVIVTTNAHIGQHVHINVGCTISHDVVIGDYSTLSPGVHIAGHVRIGNSVFIGVGANVINGTATAPLLIGDGAVIAAGACVTAEVPAGSMVAGVPAVRKR
jgi:sugar O-acyltransferase (sialic acid O-acetyltransferase NeuD family)